MRPEVKVGLFVGFVAIAGFAIWWFSKSTDELGELPFDKAAADATSFDGSSLPNNDSKTKSKPKPAGNDRRSDTAKKPPARDTNPQRDTRSANANRHKTPAPEAHRPTTPAQERRKDIATPSMEPPKDSLFGDDDKQPTLPPRKIGIEPPAKKEDAPVTKREEPIKKEEPATPTNTTPPRPQPTPITPPPERKRETEPRPLVPRANTSATTEYTMQRDDTLSSIATEKYGDERYYRAIQAANPDLGDPRRIQIGQKIKLPSKAEADRLMQPRAVAAPKPGLQDRGSGSVARASYVVGRGDTLTKIARNVLGDESRWREIFELNRDKLKSPDLIRPGMELKVPARATSRSREPRG